MNTPVVRCTLLAATVVAASVLAACSQPQSTAVPPSSQSAASSSRTATSVSTTTTHPVSTPPREDLLTPADVGPGYAVRDYQGGYLQGSFQEQDPSVASPCGKPSIEAQYPNAPHHGRKLEKPLGLTILESVTVFPDAATSGAALTAGVAGMNCASPAFGGPGNLVAGFRCPTRCPVDVTGSVGGTKALQWMMEMQGGVASVVAVQAGDKLVTVTTIFIGGVSAPPADSPDAVVLAKKGVAKLTG